MSSVTFLVNYRQYNNVQNFLRPYIIKVLFPVSTVQAHFVT